jgi:hypothetical protein
MIQISATIQTFSRRVLTHHIPGALPELWFQVDEAAGKCPNELVKLQKAGV